MGAAVLEAVPAICEVRLVLAEPATTSLVDLARFGQPNDNEVYYAADRPFGQIEGHVLAEDAPDGGLAWDLLTTHNASGCHIFARPDSRCGQFTVVGGGGPEWSFCARTSWSDALSIRAERPAALPIAVAPM